MKYTTLLHISLATATVILATSCSLGPKPASPDRTATTQRPRVDRILELAPAAPLSTQDVVDMTRKLDRAHRDVVDELDAAAKRRPVLAYPMPSVADVIGGIRDVRESL